MAHRPTPQIHRSAAWRRGATLVATAAAVVGLATGCAGERPTLEAAPSTIVAASTTTTAPAATTTTIVLADLPPSALNVLGYIATPKGAPSVWKEPKDGAEAIPVNATSPLGAPTTFAVVGDPDKQPSSWLKVLLPTRPNDSVGFVRASDVTVTHTPLRVFVDLGARKLTVQRDAETVMSTTIAVGSDRYPTPTGTAYMTELIESVPSNGAYGPYALGLSLHSNELTEFGDGGDGQVGIHGTNQPSLIGQPVSHGCVRLSNDEIRKLVDLQLPLGVPVFIS